MPHARNSQLTFRTYQHLLDVMMDNAMIVVRHVADELEPNLQASPPSMNIATVARNFVIIAAIVRRSVVVSRYLETLPVPTEEREHRLGPALDRVFRIFATRKMSVEEYDIAMDAEIDGDLEEEFDDELLDDDELDAHEREYDPDADVPGRPPAALVAELCRDFGMIARSVPADWLKPVPTELRLLCARAAAASIRPSVPAKRTSRGAAR